MVETKDLKLRSTLTRYVLYLYFLSGKKHLMSISCIMVLLLGFRNLLDIIKNLWKYRHIGYHFLKLREVSIAEVLTVCMTVKACF